MLLLTTAAVCWSLFPCRLFVHPLTVAAVDAADVVAAVAAVVAAVASVVVVVDQLNPEKSRKDLQRTSRKR